MRFNGFLNRCGTRHECGLNGEHAAMVNGKDRNITDANLIATAAPRPAVPLKTR